MAYNTNDVLRSFLHIQIYFFPPLIHKLALFTQFKRFFTNEELQDHPHLLRNGDIALLRIARPTEQDQTVK